MTTLVAGWFSFERYGATAGDLIARDLICEWLDEVAESYDIAVAPPFQGGVDWREVDPARYDRVAFVCGPMGNGWPVTEFLDRFRGRRLLGVNLSMIEPLEIWNPFDVLLERDSSARSRADLTFLAKPRCSPVVGVILVHDQHEYPRGMHAVAHAAIERLLDSVEAARIPIDTRLDVNTTGLRTAGEIESLIRRMDAVVTTRLHGLVLALKNGVPALAIDPFAGGAKIRRQCEAIGWPIVFDADAFTDAEVRRAFDFCLIDAARDRARDCAARAATAVADVRHALLAHLRSGPFEAV